MDNSALHGVKTKEICLKQTNMNITPVFLEEKIYGTFDVINNQSEGLIKLFHHKKIDLALNPMGLSMDRSYVVDIVVIGSDEVKGNNLWNISMMNLQKL